MLNGLAAERNGRAPVSGAWRWLWTDGTTQWWRHEATGRTAVVTWTDGAWAARWATIPAVPAWAHGARVGGA